MTQPVRLSKAVDDPEVQAMLDARYPRVDDTTPAADTVFSSEKVNSDYVSGVAAQTLADRGTQARANIGAPSQADLDTVSGDAVALEDLITAFTLPASISATTSVLLGAALYPAQVAQLSLAFSAAVAASDTDYWTVDVRRYRNGSPLTIATKTTKTTGGQAITAFTGWTFDLVAALSTYHFAKDDVLVVRFTPTAAPAALTAGAGSLRWTPSDGGADPATTIAADTFTRADSATSAGSTETGGFAWANIVGTWGISTNQLYLATAPSQRNYVGGDFGVSDCTLTWTITAAAAGSMGPMFRMSSTTQTVMAENCWTISGNTVYKISAGTLTPLAQLLSQTIVAGDTVAVVLSGANITVFRNGTQIGTYTDAYLQTATVHGFRVTGSGPNTLRLDNFSVTVP